MKKYEYGKINDLNKSMVKNGIDDGIIQKIMGSGDLIKPKSRSEEKAEWCFNAMNKMDELLDENTRKKVREDCACCLGGKRHKVCKEINEKYSTPQERIKAISETYPVFGYEIKITGKGKYEVSFFNNTNPEFKCVCQAGSLYELNKKWSKTWCYCCGGHVKHHLETLLGKKVNVKIISSSLTSKGRKNCHFELVEMNQ